MAKILSKSGESLADAYDVQGSIAGIDELISREVSLVHEMGSTIFSERLNGQILRIATGAVAQNVNFDITVQNLPTTPLRVHAVTLFASVQARTSLASVSLRARNLDREVAVLAWDSGFDNEVSWRASDNGAAVGTHILLRPTGGYFPNGPNLMGGGNVEVVNVIMLRGLTSGFGAGTVEIVASVYISFSALAGISSEGLPLPSW